MHKLLCLACTTLVAPAIFLASVGRGAANPPASLSNLEAAALEVQGKCELAGFEDCANFGVSGIATLPSRYGGVGSMFVSLDAVLGASGIDDPVVVVREVAKRISHMLVPAGVSVTSGDVASSINGAKVSFDQFVGNLPVFGGRLRIIVNQLGRSVEASSTLVPAALLPSGCEGTLTEHDAVSAAESRMLDLGIGDVATGVPHGVFGIYPPHLSPHDGGFGGCGWQVVIPTEYAAYLVVVDSDSGEARVARVAMENAPTEIWDARQNTTDGDDVQLCSGKPCASYSFPRGNTTGEANEMAEEFSDYLDYWFSRYGWDKGDQTGLITVRAEFGGPPYTGAVFDWGTLSVKLGSDAVCRDILAHEFTHGMVCNEINGYSLDSLWLADGLGDAFGEMFELDRTGSADWLHGTGGTCPAPRRSLVDPPSMSSAAYNSQPYPDNRWMFEASFGNAHHFNAGIVGKLAYLLGRGTTSAPSVYHWGVTSRPIGEDWTNWTLMNAIFGMQDSDDFDVVASRMVNSTPLGTIRTNVQNAVWATGAWSLEGSLWLSADSGVDFATFLRNGTSVQYAFSNITSSSNIVYRYRSCALSSLCWWSTPTVVGPTAEPTSTPAVQEFNGKLHLAYMSLFFGYPILVYQYLDENGTLGGLAPMTGNAQGRPAMAVFNNKLHVFYRRAGSGATEIVYRTLDDAGSWSGEIATNKFSKFSPAVVAPVEYRLWLFYVPVDRLRFSKMNGLGEWGSTESVPHIEPRSASEQEDFGVSDDPYAELSSGRIYVTWYGAGREHMIAYGPEGFGVQGWTRVQEQYMDSQSGRQRFNESITADGGDEKLYRVMRKPDNSMVYRSHVGH